MCKLRQRAEEEERNNDLEVNGTGSSRVKAVDELRNLVELCVKSNFGGIESFRLYSQTYYGTKENVQDFIEEGIVALVWLESRVRFADDDTQRRKV